MEEGLLAMSLEGMGAAVSDSRVESEGMDLGLGQEVEEEGLHSGVLVGMVGVGPQELLGPLHLSLELGEVEEALLIPREGMEEMV